ncbi:hypothetical protein CVT25_002427 [Psilocybe cyanescens]|uniref:PCI domain-containing protein n=1 Tax=Psilocybe cyanescens TaxID=93625 RepID=A0A409WK53_PSICY|nr:hypothetical protein CVT25_002427 [Psilocybe cyanescens]
MDGTDGFMHTYRQLDSHQYQPALALIETRLTELKRLDDKMILTEMHLLESRVYHGPGNMPKAKASLTSSYTAANAIYCQPDLPAQLDLQSGIMHAEEKDYSTTYSYLFEAFENLSALGEGEGASGGGKALEALKYMLWDKAMLSLPEDLNALLTIKLALRYTSSRDVKSMRAVARAHQKRDLRGVEGVSGRTVIRSNDPHLTALYDTLFEDNLKKIVEPYSVVEVAYVAEQVGQERQAAETELSKMSLDKVRYGMLDQGRGCLVIYGEPKANNTYGAAIEALEQISKVVESLYAKTVKIA